jgi:branched-chain amino acid transport system permease protein
VLNLSHGAFYLLAAYLAHWIAAEGLLGGSVIGAYALSVAVTAALGAALFYLVLRPAARSVNRTMVLCLALNFAVAEVLRALFGTQAILVPALLGGSVELAGVTVARQQLLSVPVGLALFAATAWVIYRTGPGRALRAVAQDREGAEILGISPVPVIGWTFAASAGLAAVAACLVTPLTVVGPWGWISPLVKSFAVVVLGGVRHLRGIAVAAFLLAAAEVATSLWVSEGAAEYVSLLIILGVLVARPGGIRLAASG